MPLRTSLLAVFLLAGCAPVAEVERISGQVLLDGKSLPDASVTFWPKDNPLLGIIGACRTKSDGSFDVTPDVQRGQGRAGQYKVIVTQPDKEPLIMMALMQDKTDLNAAVSKLGLVPYCYWREQTTPLVMSIAKGVNELAPLELPRSRTASQKR